jgi:uncharacterized repeat protein (TIGR03803 family)
MTRLRICTPCIIFLFSVAAAIASPAQILTTLHSFNNVDGAQVFAALVQARDGSFYGTTTAGGANDDGTVFKITPSGTLTTLYKFLGGADGQQPYAGLVQGSDGNFYGTTFSGGYGNRGTVFKITPSGTLTTLHIFCLQSGCADGSYPVAGLVLASDGNFYGTTFYGGYGGDYGGGTVFKITPSGTLTTLYNFCAQSGCADGSNPFAGLVQASDGSFYGTTWSGGFDNCTLGCGTVFKLTPEGILTTLHSFCPQLGHCADGAYPIAGLVQTRDGNFYGTTSRGGDYGGGTVFKITPSGTLTALYTFCSQTGCADGSYPVAGLVQASDGNLYATTQAGGDYGGGTVFKITPSGTLTTLHSFGGADGAAPGYAALLQARDRNFYGTTTVGGANGDGTVFRIVLLRPCSICPTID